MATVDRNRASMYGFILTAALAAANPLPAFAEESHDFEITATRDAARAIHEFGSQSGVQILASAEQLAGKSLNEVTGTLSTDAGLKLLLTGTGLAHRYVGERTVALVQEEAKSQSNPRSSREAGHRSLRLAQAPDQSERDRDTPSGSDKSKTIERLEEIVVTGSRLRTAQEKAAQPLTIVSREMIDRSGATTLNDLLNMIPQASTNQLASTALVEGGAATVNLRGLPNGSTLVLVNGRRMGTSGHVSFRDSFDLNAIPIAAIERIEILSSGASAVYGADALAGVMNVILRKNAQGVTLDASYGGATDGAYDEGRLSTTLGFGSQRYRGTVVLDSYHRDHLSANDRPVTLLGDYRSLGGRDLRFNFANPGTVFAASGNLPGLSSSFAAIPRGSTGVGLTPSDFAATAGTQNLDSVIKDSWLLSDSERNSAFATLEADIGSAATGFVELLAQKSEETGSSRFLAAIPVPADAPSNPFDVPVNVFYAFPGDSINRSEFTDRFGRALVGLKGALKGAWEWEAAWLGTREKSLRTLPSTIDVSSLLSGDPQTSFNPFKEGPSIDAEVARSLAQYQVQHFGAKTNQVDAFLRGRPWKMPAGDFEIVVGALYREDQINFDGASGQIGVFDFDRSTSAAFGEVLVPLASAEVWSLGDLSATVASRRDRYSDFGNATSSQLGISWSPVPRLRMRASVAESFKAPSLFRLHFSRPFTAQVVDPVRNERYLVTDSGQVGNPALRPEEGVSQGLGFTVELGSEHTGSFSVDAWRLQLKERILQLDLQTAANLEQLFPQFVSRGSPTPADVAAGLPGRINRLLSGNVNGGRGLLEGIDIKLDYSFAVGTGKIDATAAATYVSTYTGADAFGAPVLQRAGVARTNGFAPKWKAAGGLTWSAGAFELGAGVRYISSYFDYVPLPQPRRVEASYLFDLNAAYSIDGAGRVLDGIKLRVTVRNVFDEQPPFANTFRGFDDLQGDIVGRVAHLSIQKKF